MWQQEQGILIGAVRHNDRTCVARIFTRTHGMVPFLWFLSKSGKNAARNTLLQPLTHLEFQAEYIPTDNLHHLKETKNALPYRDIPFNPRKSAIALFLGCTVSLANHSNGLTVQRKALTQTITWRS